MAAVAAAAAAPAAVEVLTPAQEAGGCVDTVEDAIRWVLLRGWGHGLGGQRKGLRGQCKGWDPLCNIHQVKLKGYN